MLKKGEFGSAFPKQPREPFVLNIPSFSCFEFILDFDIRISNLASSLCSTASHHFTRTRVENQAPQLFAPALVPRKPRSCPFCPPLR